MDVLEWQKRLTLILGTSFLIGLSIIGRLYQKSIAEHTTSVKAAESQYAFRQAVMGERGKILVKDGRNGYFALAQNELRHLVLAVPINIKDPSATAKALAPKLGIEESKIFDAINNKKAYVPPLKHGLTRQEADAIKALKLKGIILQAESVRTYPEGDLASQTLGFVNAEGKGNYGVEGAYDTILKGAQGYRVGEKDNAGRLITLEDEVEAKNGSDIVLTIDRDIQHYVELSLAESVKRYEADGGSVVIVNPKTGAIVAMATTPTYNPNEYSQVKDQATFVNPVLSSVWEPGSIAKPLVMALAIDKGLVEPDTKETFGASVKVLNHEIFTAEKKAFGEQTMTQVLENSDNVGMVWIADKLGNQAEYDGLKSFGISEAPTIKLSNVVGGSMPALKNWNDLSRANLSFGQGFSSTPLQMALAYGALANGGKLMQPYVVDEVRDELGALTKTEPKVVRQVVSPDTSRKVSTMLESVVINGHAKRAGVAGYRVGGKTGTAQVPDPTGGYYEDRHIGSLAGYFPLSNPQYAMVVKLDSPKTVKFAESSAGPTFGEIAKWILLHKQVRPDGVVAQ